MTDFAYDVDPVFGCHNWLGKLNDKGRPVIWRGAKPISAVRAVWEQQVGPLKADEFPDHECRNIQCINVVHLRPVTKSVNELRKSWAFRCRIMTCRFGHSMEGALVTPNAGRLCRTCHRKSKEMG